MGEFISDIKLYVYDIASKYFDTKSHPAHKKAQDIRELKQKTKQHIIFTIKHRWLIKHMIFIITLRN